MTRINTIAHTGGGTGLDQETDVDIDLIEPKMYRVLIHNDHYTTMDFVIEVLVKVFQMPAAQATQIMLDVHRKGQGVCGVYTLDIANSKVDQVHKMARERQFPLKSSCEEA